MSVRVGLAAVVIVAAVAGCGGGDPAPTEVPTAASTAATTPPSTPPSTPPPTPAATPTPPPQPAASRADTPAGAESFARYYMQVLDYASHTGDVSELERLGNCSTCTSQSKGIKEFFEGGGRVEGGTLKVTGSRIIRFLTSAALVNVTYDQAAGKSTAGSGQTEITPASKATVFTFTLGRIANSWQVQKLQVVE